MKELVSQYLVYYGRFYRKNLGENAKARVRAWLRREGVEKFDGLNPAQRRECIRWMKDEMAKI